MTAASCSACNPFGTRDQFCIRCATCGLHLCHCPPTYRAGEASVLPPSSASSTEAPRRIREVSDRRSAQDLWVKLQPALKRESVSLLAARAGVDRKVIQRLKTAAKVEMKTAVKLIDAAGLDVNDVYATDGPPCTCTEHTVCPGCRAATLPTPTFQMELAA